MIQRTEIPFFGNHNNASCGQCVYRMMLSYFYPDKNWSIHEMDALCGAVDGKYTWPYLPLTKLSEMGLSIKVFSKFDTKKFLDDPETYLIEQYGEDGAKNSIQNSDMDAVIQQAQAYLNMPKNDKFSRLNQSHTTAIIRELLDNDYLINMWVNSKKLNNEDGTTGHFILVHGYEGSNFIAHDPGGNDKNGNPTHQYQNRLIPDELLYAACCPKEAGETKILIAIKR